MPHAVTRYTFTVRDLPGTWIVRKVDLRETLSEPYALTLELLTPDLDHDPAVLLGAACRLTLAHSPGPARDVHGLVLRLEILDHDDHLLRLRLDIGPALALHAHRVESRLWQHTSVPDIVRDVLEDSLTAHGRRLRLDLAATYPPRETCTQYRESDLEFVQRILHEEGIAFAFDHDDDAEILVLLDDNARCPVLGELPFIPRGAAITAAESVERLDPARALGVTSLLQRDWSPLAAADAPFEHARLTHDDRGRQRLVHEHDDRRTDLDDGAVRVRRKLEQRTQLAHLASGHGTVLAFAPGRRFDLTGHPDPSRGGRHLLLRVEHHGDIPDADRHGDAQPAVPTYLNTFTCVPDTTHIRPPYTPTFTRPRIYGPHTAIVVGPEGEEIHTDEHGRIRVRFHWDRSMRRGDDCSCWVRVAQTWAGPGWGGLFLPRIGMEVVVQFLDGDPDRPLVVGCVYNSLQRPPVSLPEHKTRSGLTSESTPGGGLANQIWLEDARGRESLTLRTRRDLHTHAGHDHTADIFNNLTVKVGHTMITEVEVDHVTTVFQNCDLNVATGDLSTSVACGSRTAMIHRNDTTIVDGHTIHKTVTGSHLLTAQQAIGVQSFASDIDLAAQLSIHMTATQASIKLDAYRDIDVEARTGALGLISEKAVTMGSHKEHIDILAQTKLHARTATGDIRLWAAMDATLKGDETAHVHGKQVSIHAEESLELRVGNSSIVLTPQGIEINSAAITSAAVGHHVLSGAMIRLN